MMNSLPDRSRVERRYSAQKDGPLPAPTSESKPGTITIRRDSVAVIVPARNESEQIVSTLKSLQSQSKKPQRIIVVANNCTDGGLTAGLARSAGAEVFEMDNNPFLKAGALNQGIRILMEDQTLPEYVITIDADTILDKDFIKNAASVLSNDETIGAMSAVCDGKRKLGNTWFEKTLAALQRLEYSRAGFTRIRQNIHTLSGAGSVIRADAVLDVLAERRVLFAERNDNLVEDFEMTLEVKKHGWRCVNNYYCRAETDLMTTIPTLVKQRFRWVHGTINELRRRGWRPETRASIMTVWFALLSIPIYHLWPVLIAYHFAFGNPVIQDFWFLLFVIGFQVVSVYRLGWKSMLIAALLIPDFLFGIVRHVWILKSVFLSYRHSLEPAKQLNLQW